MNPVCVLSFVVRTYFNFLHRRLGLRSGLFSLGFPTKPSIHFSSLSHLPRPLRTPCVDQLILFGEEYKSFTIWRRVQILHLSFFSVFFVIIVVLISPSQAQSVMGLNVDVLITLKWFLKKRYMWMWNELNLCVIYHVNVADCVEHGDKPSCSLKLSDFLTSSRDTNIPVTVLCWGTLWAHWEYLPVESSVYSRGNSVVQRGLSLLWWMMNGKWWGCNWFSRTLLAEL